ncbi:RulB protein [Pseudomonas aeruginosa]
MLVDANNFYYSAEACWRPELVNRPVVIAGSNDGCVISRSNEAKALGIAMGAPVHQVREQYWREGVVICSANFALYGDMSSRMMRTLASVVPKLIVYSIDKNKLHTVDAQS